MSVRHSTSVLVIGAGAAGLAAAAELARAGRHAIVLEARERIGGRIFTRHDSALPLPLEMGAEFVHGQPAATFDLIREANATPFQIPFEHLFLRERKLEEIPDYSDQLAGAMKGLARLRGRDRSFAAFLRAHNRGKRLTRGQQFAKDFTEGFDAADTERISARSLAEEQEGLGDVDEEPQFRLMQGYTHLLEHLQRQIRRARIPMHLGRIVTEIAWSRHKVTVRCSNGETYYAPRAIITLPLGVLQLPPEAAGAVRFIPDITAMRRPLSLLASGPVIKALLVFREDFWHALPDKIQNASFMHGMDLPFPTWWTTSPFRIPLLTGWVGGPKAAAISGTGDEHLRDLALLSAARLLHISRHVLVDSLHAMHICDWPSDPFARGAYSYVMVGGMQARRHLSEPIANTLFLAGEAIDTSGNASTVAGALVSGTRAASAVLKLIAT